jgi:hypothetical protein
MSFSKPILETKTENCYSATSFNNRGAVMLIGYARVSPIDQNLDLQLDALRAAGCERTFSDKTSGARADRPGLRDALAFARGGDLLVVWKLDRLSRSLSHLVETVQELERRGIGFRSLTEGLDTSNSGGKAIFPPFRRDRFSREDADTRTHQGGSRGCTSTGARWRSSEAADRRKAGGGSEAPRFWHTAS